MQSTNEPETKMLKNLRKGDIIQCSRVNGIHLSHATTGYYRIVKVTPSEVRAVSVIQGDDGWRQAPKARPFSIYTLGISVNVIL